MRTENNSVWFISSHRPDQKIGGAETTTRAWTQALQEQNHPVVWYGPKQDQMVDYHSSLPEVDLRTFELLPFRLRTITPESLFSLVADAVREKPQKIVFSDPVNYFQLDIMSALISTGQASRIAPVFHGRPYVPSPITPDTPAKLLKYANRKFRSLQSRLILGHPQIHSIAVSESTADFVHNQVHLTSVRPDVVPPISSHSPQDCVPQTREFSGSLQVSSIARISPEKGLATRLAPLARISASENLPVSFSITGPIDDPDTAKAISYNSSDQIRMIGPKSGSDLCDQFLATDILAHPSDFEGYGLSLVEGLIHAAVPLATDIPATVSILSGSDRLSQNIYPLEPEKFVTGSLEFIRQILRHPQLLAEMSQAALEHSHRFSPGILAQSFISLVTR